MNEPFHEENLNLKVSDFNNLFNFVFCFVCSNQFSELSSVFAKFYIVESTRHVLQATLFKTANSLRS